MYFVTATNPQDINGCHEPTKHFEVPKLCGSTALQDFASLIEILLASIAVPPMIQSDANHQVHLKISR